MFFEFGIKDIIDILLVALLLYNIYRLMKESRSLNVFIGIMVFVVLWLFVTHVLEMRLLGAIMDKLVSVGVLALLILFQEEIRKFLYSLGAHQRFKNIFRLFYTATKKEDEDKEAIMPIVMACMNLSRGKVGALIVIERTTPLTDIMETGDVINANINQRLIENIFFKNSPLHDGAMIIAHRRIQPAGCIRIGHADITRMELLDLLQNFIHMAVGRQAVDLIALCTDHIQTLGADGTGRTQQRNFFRHNNFLPCIRHRTRR